MAGADLVLGVIGSQQMSRKAAEALLEDLVNDHLKRVNKAALVRVLVCGTKWSDTLDELSDFVIRKGWRFGIIGDQDFFDAAPQNRDEARRNGSLFQARPGVSIGTTLGSTLASWNNLQHHTRLLILADDETAGEDDDVMDAIETAAAAGVTVRSLPKSLEEVKVKGQEKETVVATFPDEEPDEMLEDDEGTVMVDVDSSDLDDGTDFDPDEVVDEDLDEDEPPEGLEEAIEEPDEEAGLFGVDAEPPDDDELTGLREEPEEAPTGEETAEEPERAERRTETVPEGTLTKGQLAKLADKDREAFNEYAAQYDVFPGRGIRVDTMIRRIFGEDERFTNGTAPKRPKAAKKAAKKSTAKQAPARRPATAVAPRGRAQTTVDVDAPKSRSVQSTGNNEVLKNFIDVTIAALEMVKSQL